MKTKLLMLAVIAVMMAFTACTREVIIVKESESNLELGPGEDIISINLTPTNNSRAARPIGSFNTGEELHNVNTIALYAVTSSGVEATLNIDGVVDYEQKTFTAYGNKLRIPNSYIYENSNPIYVKISGLVEDSYRIIACGYNFDYSSLGEGEPSFPYELVLDNPNSNYLYKATTDEKTIEEIFAGCNSTSSYISVNEHGKFSTVPKIELTRQVAGLMAYFTNVPIYVDNKRVAKISVSGKANVKGFYFPASLHGKNGYNGVEEEGWNDNNWVDYLTFDLTKNKDYGDYDNINYYNGATYSSFDHDEKNYILAEENANLADLRDFSCKEGTLFGSCFLLPYPKNNDFSVSSVYNPTCATLNICYWEENSESIEGSTTDKYNLIRRVPLKNNGDYIESLNGNKAWQYGILCNNFYSIGTKNSDEYNAEQGTDTPLDINEATGYDYAEVSISAGWTATHDLTNK